MEKDLIIETLDETLSRILLEKEDGNLIEETNILFQGNELQGFDGLKIGGIVKKWAEQYHDKINPYYIDCPVLKVANVNQIDLLFGENQIENMNRQNSVIILKCLDWTDKKQREQYIKLVKSRTVSTLSGDKKLENILFIIATENDISRMGYEPLDEETKKLFKVIKI